MAIKLSRVIPKKALNVAFLNYIVKNDCGFQKHKHPSADTSTLEAEIEEIVYDSNSNKKRTESYSIMNNFATVLTKYDGIQIFVSMYGLTEEERKIVEGV